MTTNQLYFAMTTTLIAIMGLVVGLFYKYLDARFTAIDNQLKFVVDHVIDHIERIAKLEERTKDK